MKSEISSVLVEHADRGEVVSVGQYHGPQLDDISWRDKTSGVRMTAVILRHTVLVGNQAVSVQERLADGFDKSKWVPRGDLKPGCPVVIVWKSLGSQRGLMMGEGTIIPVDGQFRK